MRVVLIIFPSERRIEVFRRFASIYHGSLSVRLSTYARELKQPEKSRYMKKSCAYAAVLTLLTWTNRKWSATLTFCHVWISDIKDYLVHVTSFITREQLKSYKALEAHNYLTSGWVQELPLKALADSRVVIVGRVSSFIFLQYRQVLCIEAMAWCRALMCFEIVALPERFHYSA